MELKELWRHSLGRQVPGCSLRAALTELEYVRVGRLGPRTAHAHIAVRLVLLREHGTVFQADMLLREDCGDCLQRSPSARCVGVISCRVLFFHYGLRANVSTDRE